MADANRATKARHGRIDAPFNRHPHRRREAHAVVVGGRAAPRPFPRPHTPAGRCRHRRLGLRRPVGGADAGPRGPRGRGLRGGRPRLRRQQPQRRHDRQRPPHGHQGVLGPRRGARRGARHRPAQGGGGRARVHHRADRARRHRLRVPARRPLPRRLPGARLRRHRPRHRPVAPQGRHRRRHGAGFGLRAGGRDGALPRRLRVPRAWRPPSRPVPAGVARSRPRRRRDGVRPGRGAGHRRPSRRLRARDCARPRLRARGARRHQRLHRRGDAGAAAAADPGRVVHHRHRADRRGRGRPGDPEPPHDRRDPLAPLLLPPLPRRRPAAVRRPRRAPSHRPAAQRASGSTAS